jgi:hypothetical protein
VGGHALAELLPRALFADHPEYFPCAPSGGRTDLGNVCGTSAAALAVVSARARALRALWPHTGAIHVWGHDLWGGGWCACVGCRSLSPSDQALRVANAVAAGAGIDVFHLAYHDTIAPPTMVRPDAGVIAEFAPRERCYGHALDDATCTVNPRYRAALEAHLALFDGRVDVFEYYGDAILFGGCAVPLVEVIGRDLDYYARAGVRGVSCLVFGTYSLSAYGANVEAFARGAVVPAATRAAAAARGAHRYGPAAPAMAAYLAALERAMAGVVQYGDVLLPARERRAEARFAYARAARDFAAVRRLLPAGPRDGAERALFEFTAAVVAALAAWLRGGPAPDATLAGAIRGIAALDASVVGTWGAYDLELTHGFFANARRES